MNSYADSFSIGYADDVTTTLRHLLQNSRFVDLRAFGFGVFAKGLYFFYNSLMISLTERIRALLESNNIEYSELDHAPAPTCEISATQRGESIEIGGKTILFKDKRDYRLFVISAALQVDSNKVRKILKSQRLRFATHDELMELIGVEKGALPPFGRELLPYDLYLDESILKNEKIAFNAGILTKSFILKTSDYLKLVDPVICSFAK